MNAKNEQLCTDEVTVIVPRLTSNEDVLVVKVRLHAPAVDDTENEAVAFGG
jgi:hypothetical protein